MVKNDEDEDEQCENVDEESKEPCDVICLDECVMSINMLEMTHI